MPTHPLIAATTALLTAAPTQAIKRFGPIRALIQSRAWQTIRHRLILSFGERDDSTFTRFLRVATQLDALTGPVLSYVGADAEGRAPIRILLVGCSTGAEPYTIVSELLDRRPGLPFEFSAYDLRREMVEQARKGTYTATEVLCDNPPADFVVRTFESRDDVYVVKAHIARHVTFATADLLDPELPDRIGTGDIVFAQNVMINFSRSMTRRAFANVRRLLRARAALFIDGMDVDLRTRLTRDAGLIPLDYKIREIHEDARRIRGGGWPWKYWGLEPLRETSDWRQRYATVFLQGS